MPVPVPVRRSSSALTPAERAAFVAAVLELKRRGGYDPLVQIHSDRMMADGAGTRIGHQSPSFFPWHRRFLLEFERRLRQINPVVTLPYWNWTVDATPTSPVWGADFLGGDGQPGDRRVTTGKFAYATGNWTLNVRLDTRPYLVRSLGAGTATLPTAAELTTALNRTPYDTAPWSADSPGGMRTALEGLHNRVHVWVGGQMLQTVSPDDPVFFLHHAFMDKCWADWFALRPAGTSQYLPLTGTANVVDADELMPPWNDMRPTDLMDHTRFYTYA